MDGLGAGQDGGNCIQRPLFLLFLQPDLQRTDLDPVFPEGQGRRVPVQQHLPVERPDGLRRQDQAQLMVRQQPLDAAFLAADALVLAECLAPAFEVGRVTYQFAFEHPLHMLLLPCP